MKTLYRPANDDKPTQAWQDLEADTELFNRFMEYDPEFTMRIKKTPCERRVSNFIWFLKFEISHKEIEPLRRRDEFEVVT